MIKPDYEGGSIINLMSTIGRVFNYKSKYKECNILPSKDLEDARRVILINIDGLGYEFLKRHGRDSYIYKNLIGKLTTTFPATTAVATTAYSLGVPAQQHGLTGWFMNMKEFGCVGMPLPFIARNGYDLSKIGSIDDIIDAQTFQSKLNCKSYFIIDKEYEKTSFTKKISKGSKVYGAKEFKNITTYLKRITKNESKFYSYVYWSKFDTCAHHNGINSEQCKKIFNEIDEEVEKLCNSIKQPKTTILLSADHGLIDNKSKENLKLENFPKLEKCLAMPLSGDSRMIICNVIDSMKGEFERIIKTDMKKYCKLYKSEKMLKEKLFGLGRENPKLRSRIGDYILLMKENYTLSDKVEGERRRQHVGHHSGMSKDEMYVPLFVKKI